MEAMLQLIYTNRGLHDAEVFLKNYKQFKSKMKSDHLSLLRIQISQIFWDIPDP
jgi:hypothetical protein